MFPNPVDFEAAVARINDLLLQAGQERTLRALAQGSSSDAWSGRRRLGELLIRVGRRIEGIEAAPAGAAGAASRAY